MKPARMHVFPKACTSVKTILVMASLLTTPLTLCAAEPTPETIANWRFNALQELPVDTGRDLVLRACVQCHDLGGLAAYRGYWALAQWQAMVESMVKNGSVLSPLEIETVAAYLARYYGRNSSSE